MQSKELIKMEEKSIFYKIKKFFKNIFCKNTVEKDIKIEQEKNIYNFKEDIKIKDINEFNGVVTIDELVAKIEKNPELLNNLSEERLDKLLEYYQKIIEIKKNKILELKK